MRQAVSFTLLRSTRDALTRIAEEAKLSKSRMVEDLIHEAHGALEAVNAAKEGAE